MSDADKAAARVEAFLPELADVPDESRAARLGARQLADDVRLVFDDRELLRAEVARLKAELDEVTDLDRSALRTQELRDERSRAVAWWHDQKKRADAAEAELARLRGDVRATPPIPEFIRSEQTCFGCPSQWDAWDADGNQYYLRFRWGVGSISLTGRTVGGVMRYLDRGEEIATFDTGDGLDGIINLEEFLDRARAAAGGVS